MGKKRRPGGGRKKMDLSKRKSEQVHLRIDATLRSALEAQAAASGKSVSEIATRLMKLGYEQRRGRLSDAPMRALCYLIGELAALICNFKGPDGKPVLNWRTNPFAFEALEFAISEIMKAMKPPGAPESPIKDHPGMETSTVWGPHDTPQRRGEWAASMLWNYLQVAKPVSFAGDGLPSDMRADLEWTAYGMSEAQKDLLG
jgi:hypothetical protein